MIELNILEINANVDLEIVGTFFTYEANEYCSKAQIFLSFLNKDVCIQWNLSTCNFRCKNLKLKFG